MQWTEFGLTRANGPTGRVNDIAVVGDQRWAVSSDGRLFSWQAGAAPAASALPGQQHARCIAFDSGGQIGWIGLLMPNPPTGGKLTRLLKTTDGGANWAQVANLPADPAEGICGISVVRPDLAFACGTYVNAKVPGVWRTNDGTNWDPITLPDHVSGLTDIKFWSATDGILIGKRTVNGQTSPLILLTDDAGETWQYATVPNGLQDGAHCWKVARYDANLFHIAVAGTGGDYGVVLKSTDGGQNWDALKVTDSTATVEDWQLQGIEFISPTHGWVGQHGEIAFETTDSGQSWQPADSTLSNLNRFAATPEGLYATGNAVYLGSDAGSGNSGKAWKPSPKPKQRNNPSPSKKLAAKHRPSR